MEINSIYLHALDIQYQVHDRSIGANAGDHSTLKLFSWIELLEKQFGSAELGTEPFT